MLTWNIRSIGFNNLNHSFLCTSQFLARRSSGPASESRRLRISIHNAKRSSTSALWIGMVIHQGHPLKIKLKRPKAPSPFAVITIDEIEMYNHFRKRRNATDPGMLLTWKSEILSNCCCYQGLRSQVLSTGVWSAFIGWVFQPFSPSPLLPPPIICHLIPV